MINVLSDSNIRRLQVDLAQLRNDGIIPESEADGIVGVNLIHEPEKIERALALFRKYSAMPSKRAQKAAASNSKPRKAGKGDDQ